MDSYALRKLEWKRINAPGSRRRIVDQALKTPLVDDAQLKKLIRGILEAGSTFQDALVQACDEKNEEHFLRVVKKCNTWPYGVYSDEVLPRYLSIGLRNGSFSELMDDLLREVRAMESAFPGYETAKSAAVLVSTFDASVYSRYEDQLIQTCVNNNILLSMFLVTDYSVSLLPLFMRDREQLKSLHGSFGQVRFMDREKASGELEWYPVDYYDGEKTWEFDFYHMTWERFRGADSEDTPAASGKLDRQQADDFYEIAMNYFDYADAVEDENDFVNLSTPAARVYNRSYDLTQKALEPFKKAFEELIRRACSDPS